MSTAELEQRKYRKMWAQAQYREASPGEQAVPAFLHDCQPLPGATIADVGAGTGRAGKKLAEAGFHVTLLDCCPEANETALPCQAVIVWELPVDLPRVDWVFCVDVLEHIPTEHVKATLAQMARLSRLGGYLRICCVPDQCGRLIGETLHLTVQPAAWWTHQIADHWPILARESDGVHATFVVGEPYDRN